MTSFPASSQSANEHFVAYSTEFLDVVGDDPQFCELIETNAHEGPVYVKDESVLYFTSAPEETNVPLSGFKGVAIKRLRLAGDEFPFRPQELAIVREPSNMANGMTLGP